jgi:predicted metalloprotease
VIFKDTETVWGNLFEKMGEKYRQPTLVMFTDRVNSACGAANAAVGPFYCPGDEKVYIDLSFYREMQRKLDAPGDFARAYVIAHEVGHHVQKLLGYDQKAEMIRQRNKSEASVRLELQADYLAGVWAYHGQKTFKFLQPGDLESALNAAWQIGDDTLTRKAGGIVREEAFTHGSSAERQRWFRKGFDTGSVSGAAALFDLPYRELKPQE